MKQLVKIEIDENLTKCSLTTDAWTSNATESFLGLTGHYIDSNYCLRSIVLNLKFLNQSHSAEYFYNSILECLEEWNLVNKVNSKYY